MPTHHLLDITTQIKEHFLPLTIAEPVGYFRVEMALQAQLSILQKYMPTEQFKSAEPFHQRPTSP